MTAAEKVAALKAGAVFTLAHDSIYMYRIKDGAVEQAHVVHAYWRYECNMGSLTAKMLRTYTVCMMRTHNMRFKLDEITLLNTI